MSKKIYRYSWDENGYYSGIVRGKPNSLGLIEYPTKNVTDVEPYWQDGYRPRWSLKECNWVLEKRDKAEKRAEFYHEAVAMLLPEISMKIEMINRNFTDQMLDQNEILTDEFCFISKELTRLSAESYTKLYFIENKLNKLSDTLSLVVEQIVDLHNHQIQMREEVLRLHKPTLWQRIKNWFTKP